MNLWDGPLGAILMGSAAIGVTWEIIAALRRGWSSLKTGWDRSYRDEQPFGYWLNIFVHAAVALGCWWCLGGLWFHWW